MSTDPHGTRLPIKLDTTSNGEFVPVPLTSANREANRRELAVRGGVELDRKAGAVRVGGHGNLPVGEPLF